MADPSENETGKNPPDPSQEQPDVPVTDDTIKNESRNSIEKPNEPQESEPQESEKIDLTLQCMVEDPVEILVGLAERGEIDPWNIDIIEVTDRFLNELESRRELNIQVSGRTLFYAATLVRMKSEQLVIIEPPEDDGEGDGEDLFGEEFGGGLSEDIDYGG